MASPLDDTLARFSRKYRRKAKELEPKIRRYINEGYTPSQAVDMAMQDTGFRAAIRTMVRDAVLSSAVIGAGSVKLAQNMPLNEAWDESGMTLSQKLHGTSATMRNRIVKTVREQLKTGDGAIKSARALYDGYKVTDNAVRKQTLPKYLNKILTYTRRSDLSENDVKRLQKLIRRARHNVARLAQNGAPNKALKTSYKELLDAVESTSDKAIERAIKTAVEEKSRYVAERIARTESARAWYQGFIADTENDTDVVAYRFVESTRHPTEDICDTFANQNHYGWGKGVYPKGEQPELPIHPHCLCHYEKVYRSEIQALLRGV